jgi:integrase
MRVADLSLAPAAAILIRGKGRKERSVPLWPRTASQLRDWIKQIPRNSDQPLFPNRGGGRLTRTSVANRLRVPAGVAAQRYPELARMRITPHLVRHSTVRPAIVDATSHREHREHETPVRASG